MKGLERARRGLSEVARDLLDADRLALVPRLTLVYLLLNPGVRWPDRVPFQLLAVFGLLSPRLAGGSALWGLLSGFWAIRLLSSWPHSDNHDYLAAYWCLALAVAFAAPEPRRALAWNGRLLLGLAFAFATLWKVLLSPDFLDGSFFRATLLFDSRFADFAVLLGGMTPEQFAENERFLEGGAAVFREPARLVALAQVATWLTLLSEGAIAVCFLIPRGALGRMRDALLLGFLGVTYAVATVPGFGWLLVILGLAQSEPQRRAIRGLYLGAFALVLLHYGVPWTEWLVRALSE